MSHVLSRRLSSRPMGWSSKTLKKFVPILAAGGCSFQKTTTKPMTAKTTKIRQIPAKVLPSTLGLPHPDMVASMPAKQGKVTPLYRLLRSFSK